MEQRSSEWYEKRGGKATSSCISKILGVKGLGETGNTYAFEKAVEIVFGIDLDEGYTSYDMQIGIEREPLAFDAFKSKMELEFNTVETCDFFVLGNDTGGSPDGLVNSKFPLETKCPKPVKYFGILRYGLQECDKEWLQQLNHQMYVLGVEKGYLNLYTIYNGKPYNHFYLVERDEAIIKKIKERLPEWVKLRDEHVEILKQKL